MNGSPRWRAVRITGRPDWYEGVEAQGVAPAGPATLVAGPIRASLGLIRAGQAGSDPVPVRGRGYAGIGDPGRDRRPWQGCQQRVRESQLGKTA